MKYKVGDRVKVKSLDWYNENKDEDGCVHCGDEVFDNYMSVFCGSVVTIGWVYPYNRYDIREDMHCRTWTDEMIEGPVEEEIEFTEEDKYWCDIMSKSSPTTYILPEGYIFKDEYGNVINATKIVLEKKKPYPKTYEECCKVLNTTPQERCQFDFEPYGEELYNLHRLLVCCDAYWKIAGDEMGLGRPWKPAWLDDDTKKYVITSTKVFETFGGLGYTNYILTFPTREMRDAFKENFDPDIEICKELL